MKLVAVLTLFCSVLASASIPNLNDGIPGCLDMVLSQPVGEDTAEHLTTNCRDLRRSYLDSLNLYSKNKKEFIKEIGGAIRANKTPEPAYRAILIAALFEDKSLAPALEVRAKLEESKKYRFQYGSAALERLRKGRCGPRFADSQYDEVCRLSSAVAERIVLLTEKYEELKR
ncbi:MAG: hypothetical protein JST80_05180 [Bdellovibrionales bacterium]|nr:hypothetical protein [Bdellovibrionales bacterium]